MARSKPPPTLLLRSRRLAGSPLGRLLVRLSVAAAVLLVSGIVMRQARAQAFRLPDYRLSASSVVYEDLPSWADARIKAELLDPARLPLVASVFDPAADDHVRAIVSRHPLVRKVTEVRVLYPRRVAVKVALRFPACWVETPVVRPDGRRAVMLLSSDGHRLDERCYEGYLAQRPRLPLLTGVKITQPPVPGVPWDNFDEQVAEGLAAARVGEQLARDLAWGPSTGLARIDVSRFPSVNRRQGGEVLLLFHDARSAAGGDGIVVEWGRTERDLRGLADEDSYEKKKLRLKMALEQGQRRIDVRFPTDPLLR